MTEILRQKLLKLVRGDDGVALVVTLALFMFLYVSCAGVYTVGRAVKDRIILQNAVDAAAYSAAVVQADYLSRIATINRAMAWNYAQLLKSQRNWIVLRFLQKINEDPTKRFNRPLTVKGSEKKPWYIDVDVRPYLDKDIGDYQDEIANYYGDLLNQEEALTILKKGLRQKVLDTVNEVLMANLPFRIGEQCRVKIRPSLDSILNSVNSDVERESQFLELSADDDVVKLKSLEWFKLDERLTEGFARTIPHEGLLQALDWETSVDGEHWQHRPGFDAYDWVSDTPCHASAVTPLTLTVTYFPDKGSTRACDGAITVAVAKWNENPWKQLVRDLTGIHAAFDYGEKNDWTFAIASAQAGYRSGGEEKDGRREAREYSLDDADFDFVTFGKKNGKSDEFKGQDWDALYIPVRMAFSKSGFNDWLKEDSSWELLVPESERKYISEPLEEIRFHDLNHKALARMHNNAGIKDIMKWDTEEMKDFLDLMYH